MTVRILFDLTLGSRLENMPLPFGDTHPSAASPVDTTDLLSRDAHLRDLETKLQEVQADRLRMQAENLALLTENRLLHRLATDACGTLSDSPTLHAQLRDLEADKRRLEAQVRALHAASRRANDAWETKHIFGFALKEPTPLP